jgi:hypothetical protein
MDFHFRGNMILKVHFFVILPPNNVS